MPKRPTHPTDEDAESSLESNSHDGHDGYSIAHNTQPLPNGDVRVDWEAKNDTKPPMMSTPLPETLLTTTTSNAASARQRHTRTSPQPSRNLWSSSLLTVVTSLLGIAVLGGIIFSFVSRPSDAKGCRMSFMRPSYVRFSEFDTEHTRFATKYSLYLYREQGVDNDKLLQGIPVLFIPGNAGSYKQVRPIAAEAAIQFHGQAREGFADEAQGARSLDFFTVDFNEDITAFHGQTLLDQAEYLNEAVRYILSLYSDPHRHSREPGLPDPTSVIILGHSMGGVVARAMLVQPNYMANSINTILTLSAPHARPPVTFDGQLVQIYDEINEYWRRAYAQKWANNNPLWHVTLVSIAGGSLDSIVPSDYASLESLVPETHGFTVFSTGIPFVWTAMDHQAILWCDQFRKVISRVLLELVDVRRASQTKSRADRMGILKQAFLSGLEPNAEQTASFKGATALLTLSNTALKVVPPEGKLVLNAESGNTRRSPNLITIPPANSPEPVRFTLLTNLQTELDKGDTEVDVLLCSRSPPHPPAVSSSHFSTIIDFGVNGEPNITLACRNAAADRISLPAPNPGSNETFCLERDCIMPTYSYLQYSADDLYDHEFVAVIDRSPPQSKGFLVAEFSKRSDFHLEDRSTLPTLLTKGNTIRLTAERPMVMDIQLPNLRSALFTYDLRVSDPHCAAKRQQSFKSFIRQYLEQPYESRFLVNTERASLTLHGVAPFMPMSLGGNTANGLTLQLWSDPTCNAPIDVSLQLNILASLGKLYMRYRTVFAAFPLFIITLVLRQQFRIYDASGVFVSFAQALDVALRQSIPLLLLSLTLLALSTSGGLTVAAKLLRWRSVFYDQWTYDYENELLIGTTEPVFWFLVPLIGVTCVGVCVVLHYVSLTVTRLGTFIYRLYNALSHGRSGHSEAFSSSPSFMPSTPRRRMITTAILLFLVATFIPYQFAYLVACLVQLLTVTRALAVQDTASSLDNTNYYNYAHSILLLMLWVLPINMPILAVWIRNLAVHWLTPFSSHHNVLSIMPFILLVENLTTGKMVPRVRVGFRWITSVLLFGTGLCAALYGVSHAYLLHYMVNVIVAWLVIVHSTAGSWSVARLNAMFEVSPDDARTRGKRP